MPQVSEQSELIDTGLNDLSQQLPPIPQQAQLEMPAARETVQRPILPRDALLAKVRAFRESQDRTKHRAEPVQLTMPVNPGETGPTPDLESAKRLARDVANKDLGRDLGRYDEKTYDIPAFIRKNQRPPESNL